MKARNLIWIGIILTSVAAGAVVLDWFERNRESKDMLGRTVLGPVDLRKAGIVLIETPTGQVTMRRTAWGWTVDEQGGFSADANKIRALLLQLARAPITERLRMQPQRLGDLGLLQKVENQWQFQAGRTASVLSLIHGLESRHKLIYQVLIGNHRAGIGTYVRFPASNTAYLVPDLLELDGDARHWILQRVFDEDAAKEMRSIHVRPAGQADLTFSRTKVDAPWQLEGVAGVLQRERVEEFARTVAELRVAELAVPASNGDAGPAAIVEVHFFDESAIVLALHPPPRPMEHRRAVLAARVAAGNGDPEALWRVEVFNRRFGGRIVRLDAEQTERLLRGRTAYVARR